MFKSKLHIKERDKNSFHLLIISNNSDEATAVFKPLKKNVSPRIFATASKVVLQRSVGGLKGKGNSFF